MKKLATGVRPFRIDNSAAPKANCHVKISSLGYVGVASPRAKEFATFGPEILGTPLWTEPNVYFLSKRIHGTANGIYRYGVWSFNDTGPETWWLEPK